MKETIGAKPPQDTITTEFKDGKRIITHPSGLVVEETIEDMRAFREMVADEIKIRQGILVEVDRDIAEAIKTLPK